MPVPLQLEHQRNRHHIHLAADGVRELVQRQQRGQRGVGEGRAARHRKHLPVDVVAALGVLAGADEAAGSRVDRGIEPGRLGAGVDDVPVPEVDEMLRGRVHAFFVVDADGGVKALGRRRIDADDRHMDALQLLHLVRVDGKRGHEHGVHIAPDGQLGEELMSVGRGVDVLEQGDVIAGRVHHRFDAGERLGVEPAGDLLVHQHRHAVGLAGLQCRGGAGDVEIELVGHFQHLVPRLPGDELGAGERARHRGNGYAGRLRHLVDVCLAHVSSSHESSGGVLPVPSAWRYYWPFAFGCVWAVRFYSVCDRKSEENRAAWFRV